jgi:hypothetical protein
MKMIEMVQYVGEVATERRQGVDSLPTSAAPAGRPANIELKFSCYGRLYPHASIHGVYVSRTLSKRGYVAAPLMTDASRIWQVAGLSMGLLLM